jgi:hypothetical protein
VIVHLVGIIKSLLRVKVVRVAVAALRNLLDVERCNEQMIDAGLPRLLPTYASPGSVFSPLVFLPLS